MKILLRYCVKIVFVVLFNLNMGWLSATASAEEISEKPNGIPLINKAVDSSELCSNSQLVPVNVAEDNLVDIFTHRRGHEGILLEILDEITLMRNVLLMTLPQITNILTVLGDRGVVLDSVALQGALDVNSSTNFSAIEWLKLIYDKVK